MSPGGRDRQTGAHSLRTTSEPGPPQTWCTAGPCEGQVASHSSLPPGAHQWLLSECLNYGLWDWEEAGPLTMGLTILVPISENQALEMLSDLSCRASENKPSSSE